VAAAVALAAAAGCTSSKPARVVEAAPEARPSVTPTETKAATPPTEIRALDLREGAPETFVDLEASAPLVWTSYRNSEGRVVVELPNALPGAGVADLSPAEGLVAALTVEKNQEGTRPLTRLVIATRQEAEHAITTDGAKLSIALTPVDKEGAGKLAFEPLKEEPASAPEPAPATTPAATAPGTPEQPAVAPAPAGVAATRLEAIEVLSKNGGAVIRIAGDGEFPYSTFALSNPSRFVVDLDGVINRAARSTVQVESATVERVRVAQFRPYPKPVSRVVFDLRGALTPRIERTADALVISFTEGAAAAPTAAWPAPAGEPSDLSPTAPAARPAPATPAVTSEEAPAAPATPARPMEPRMGTPGPSGALPGSVQPPSRLEMQTPALPQASPVSAFQPQDVGQGDRQYYGEPIDLKVTNADVTDVLRTFSQISGLNIIVQPGVRGQVTAELSAVPWDQAFEQVLKINNLDFERDGNVIRIAPTEVLRREAEERQKLQAAKALAIQLRTVYKRLSYADAQDVATVLRGGGGRGAGAGASLTFASLTQRREGGILSQRGSVIVDERTNALIIKELPSFIDSVIQIVELLDAPEPLVLIEARIVETTKRFSREIGINWGFDGVSSPATGNTTGLIFPAQGTTGGNVNLGGAANSGVLDLRLGNLLNTFTLDVQLRAAEEQGLVTILSAPKVATLNHFPAEIQSGLQIPVQTIANNTITVQYINATLRLSVIPHVTAEGTIMMLIDISKREPQLAFVQQGATNAPIATKDATTSLIVRDGGTAVIGGIYRVTADRSESRVPGLANLPLIGHLFKNKSRNEENDELLIFITPRIVKI
jgi:type IV pilus assembly protein PilQ